MLSPIADRDGGDCVEVGNIDDAAAVSDTNDRNGAILRSPWSPGADSLPRSSRESYQCVRPGHSMSVRASRRSGGSGSPAVGCACRAEAPARPRPSSHYRAASARAGCSRLVDLAEIAADESGLCRADGAAYLKRPGACRRAPSLDCFPGCMSDPCQVGPGTSRSRPSMRPGCGGNEVNAQTAIATRQIRPRGERGSGGASRRCHVRAARSSPPGPDSTTRDNATAGMPHLVHVDLRPT